MGYNRLGEPEPKSSKPEPLPNQSNSTTSPPQATKPSWLKLLLILSIVLVLATVGSVVALFKVRDRATSGLGSGRKPTVAIKKTCGRTLYPDICVESLVDFPGALSARESDLVHISVNMTLQRFGRALSLVSEFINLDMDSQTRSAYADCLELLQDTVDHLFQSLSSIAPSSDADVDDSEPAGSTQDVLTWLSAALTNQDTCSEGLGDVNGTIKEQMDQKLQNLWELASNSLAIYSSANGDDYIGGIPIQNKRRKLLNLHYFPNWVSTRDRVLLDLPPVAVQADIVVANDGSGTYKTIKEAIKKAPEKSNRRTIIYVKAGKYEEDKLKVGRKKRNLMFIGDGVGKTVITGKKSVVADKITTFHTASFAATGQGFIARDITFENYAGPGNHQAVALRVGADHAVVYRCEIKGYQDTLYVHSQRQFYRECNIYGTVDFIFGNAAVVFQNCTMHARKPMETQKNTITAQNRKDPNQNTGISIHACKLVATSDLEGSKGSFPTFLGRPWKMYSRTVYMLSYMGDHISPKGWLEWNDTFALDTLYYGEYMNYGPGASVGERVNWPGYRVMKSSAEASHFTVAKFIYGSSWLPSTGVAFLSGLTT